MIFPPGDAGALSGCLLRLAADNEARRRMAEAALRRMETGFSLAAASRRMEEIYSEVLS
jgi:glycosyltransferase involved in cell wall biosynthesis